MDEQEIVVNEYDDDTIESISEMSTGWKRWHYIKTFLSFFAFVSAGGLILYSLYEFSSVANLFWVMMGLGTICALLAIKEIFTILHFVSSALAKIVGAISFFTLIPFLPLIFGVAFYVGIFGIGLMLCAFFPYVPTLIAYFRVTMWETFNKKKEIIVALSGFLSAVLIFIMVFFIHKSIAVVGTLTIKNDLNRQQAYNEYIAEYPDRRIEELDIENPVETTYDADSRKHTDIFEFEKNVNGATYDCIVTIKYAYDDEWYILEMNEENTFKDYTLDVSGTFKGSGLYEGLLSFRDSDYTLVLDELTKEGGSGSFTIVNDTYSEQRNFTMTITDAVEMDNDFIVKINMIFDEKLNDGFTTQTECTYSLGTGELTLVSFYFDEDIVLKIN